MTITRRCLNHVLQFFGDFKHDSPRFSELPAYPWPSLASQLTLRVSSIATTGKSTIELPMIFPANPAINHYKPPVFKMLKGISQLPMFDDTAG